MSKAGRGRRLDRIRDEAPRLRAIASLFVRLVPPAGDAGHHPNPKVSAGFRPFAHLPGVRTGVAGAGVFGKPGL